MTPRCRRLHWTEMRRPVHYLVKRIGGIDPRGEDGRELRGSGLTARRSPALFSLRGRLGLDNIPADYAGDICPGLEYDIGIDGDYLDHRALIDALISEGT